MRKAWLVAQGASVLSTMETEKGGVKYLGGIVNGWMREEEGWRKQEREETWDRSIREVWQLPVAPAFSPLLAFEVTHHGCP